MRKGDLIGRMIACRDSPKKELPKRLFFPADCVEQALADSNCLHTIRTCLQIIYLTCTFLCYED